jgi:S-adenosylmethionine-dependent carboxyl methyltransferase
MSNGHASSHGVMEGRGAYNKHARLPAGGAALAMPLLEKAIQSVQLDTSEQPVVIGDYGSSQGKNSMIPMQVAIRGLRRRIGPNRAISVFHIDQPSNDFTTLFAVLDADPDRYVVDEPNVFPAAIGRSFYENVLPPGSVHLGWSSYAAVWLSRVPTLIPGHFFSAHSTGPVRAEFDRQGAKDWEAFLSLRAQELRPGGRLVIVLPALADDGSSGFQHLFDEANAALEEMVADGEITAEERSRMALGAYPRRKRDLLAPFGANREFQKLTVEDCEMSELPDAAWADYQRDEDKEALVNKQVLFFRSIFVPSLASALVRVRAGDAEALGTFGDRLEQRLKRRLASQLVPMHSFVQAMVLAKKD